MTFDLPRRDELRDRVHGTLARRIWLRFHTGMIVGSSVLVGLILSSLLQRYAVFQTALGLRYGMATVVAYLGFLAVVRWWVRYVAGVRPPVGERTEDQGRLDPATLGPSSERSPKRDYSDGCMDGLGDGCLDPGCLDLDGCLAGVAVVLVFLAVSWGLSFGSVVLTEIVADTLLAGGLVRWARRTEAAWASSALRATWIPFVVALALMVGFGLWAQQRCWQATRFGEIWACLGR